MPYIFLILIRPNLILKTANLLGAEIIVGIMVVLAEPLAKIETKNYTL
jgi:hypothetical protein